MDLDWLKDFLALAEHQTFSRAAGARHVTQPAFSRRVRALEEWVGTPLFVRSAQGATLTAAGEVLKPLASNLLRDLEQSRRDTLGAAEPQMSTLSIAATHALSFTFFPEWIKRYAALQTFGKLNLLSDTMEACEQAMASGEVQFLLCHWHDGMRVLLDLDRYPSVTVGSDVLAVVSAPTKNKQPIWPLPGTAARPTKLLDYTTASGLGRILASAPIRSRPCDFTETVFTSHLAAALLAMARDGQGAAWLPLTLAQSDLDQGHLVRAGSPETDVPVEIRLFRSADHRNRAADELWRNLDHADRSN